MNSQTEKQTQSRVIALFQERLGYDYLGNWKERPGNANIEVGLLTSWLQRQGVDDVLINRALHELEKSASDTSKHLYDRNRVVYDLLRYGVKVQPGAGENRVTVWLIDWKKPENNHFAIAEEVTVKGADAKASSKRPDIVLYVNGIALGVLELKRSSVSVAEGIRQNLDNQKKEFIQPFFSTMQWVMAGNDSEGLRYATIQTPEKYYLRWYEETGPFATETNLLDRHLLQMGAKGRFLELIHDFVVFDAGIKKVCRQNQYFGVKAAQEYIHRREGGIIWHTQGSGKSLTMVWLAKWIRENHSGSRVLIITDRTELDEQIEKVFKGVNEQIYRTKSGEDLIATLNESKESLVCSLVHKFGRQESSDSEAAAKEFMAAIQRLPSDFKAKGDIYVFVDECHRTQSGDLHKAMTKLLPNAMFIGFTGTPLLKSDKKKSIEVFGGYIHTYKFDQAVREGVVLDLRYEAREIDQSLISSQKVDDWFDAKTKGLNDFSKIQLKQRWGTLQQVLSSQSRLEKIVADILMDMNTRPRLMDGHGNAMLVAGSIYEACKFYELFRKTELQGRCAIVTSYAPSIDDAKGETSGEGETDNLLKYSVYSRMLAEWFSEPEKSAIQKIERFEQEVKKKFIHEPGQMKLLIVVDKLLTGFDAPPATYLYIDKQMKDHGLFQAICRVNRLDGDDKEYGYIVDYKDLFQKLEGAIEDYTSGAFDGYDASDVHGLLENRLTKAREKLEEAREAIKALCEPVAAPREEVDFLHYFCAVESGNHVQLKENEPKRLKLYKFFSSLLRAYSSIANELDEAGYNSKEIEQIKREVDQFARITEAVKLSSGDFLDLKLYEPAMRHLIDTYIHAEASEKISSFDDMSLILLLVDKGAEAVNALPKSIRKNQDAVAETIENNVRKLIINESPIDPAYYEQMSRLLDALIEQRRKKALTYQQYLDKIAQLSRDAKHPGGGPGGYPDILKTSAQRTLYNNLGKDAHLALAVDSAIQNSRMDGWRENSMKRKKVWWAIREILQDDALTDQILELAKHQNGY
ncbi:type I restriction endonuclease subunit R [Candidatus Magnetaquicoccus inordinatus]|uniref:type I restriction endonuclease subunit R n=1 Tax=Candidatus Magnetaquicoccus inordinatus TaxID=2496818 RepID=UPI00102C40BB|nr:HsdR family type I site-specific deoxyribonuclease [Candidatus Magnetaquicoccus inordinatus]